MKTHSIGRLGVNLVLLGIGLASPASAELLPNAGSLQRDIGRQIEPLSPIQELPGAVEPEKPKGAQDVTVTLKRFIIEGATLIPAYELEGLLSDLQGKALTLSDLDAATVRISDLYRSRGWFVRVWLPEQEIQEGIIRIAVLEGNLSEVRLEGGQDSEDLAMVGRVVANRLTIGEVLTTKDLERGLLLANDLPGVKATGVLEPGKKTGETAVNVQVEPGQVFTADTYYNNFGYRSTGRQQFGGGLAIAPGEGRLLTFRGQGSSDLGQGNAGFATPLGSDGARLNLDVSGLAYQLGGAYEPLDANGNAQTYSSTISWPWLRSAEANLFLSAGFEHSRFNDYILDAAFRRRRINQFNLEVNGDSLDTWGGGGRWDASGRVVLGDLDLGDVPDDLALDNATTRASGQFQKFGGRLSRLQALDSDTSLYFGFTGQVATKNLNFSQKFSLGGPYGVRAYPVGEAPGDDAWIINLELRRELGYGFRGTAFFDTGWSRTHHNLWEGWNAGGNLKNSYQLSGAGLSVSWNKPKDISLEATVALPIGPNPGEFKDDYNQDGSERGARLWMTVTKYF